MRILVMGTGGVGGYFGARLAAAGHDTTFIARGAHLEALRSDGLRVTSALGDLHLAEVDARADASGLEPVDLVMVAVKLWSTGEAVETIAPAVGPGTAVVSFQNGVDAGQTLVEAFGPARVMGGVAHIAAVIESPGIIRHGGTMARLRFGELDGSRSERGEAFLAACESAGVQAQLSDDIVRVIWEKFVFLSAMSAMTSATRLPVGPVRENEHSRALLGELMEEAAAVGRACGASLPEDCAQRQLGAADALPADMISSMLGNLRRGGRLELEWLSGAVVRLGQEHGVDTPASRAVRAVLAPHAGGAVQRPE